METLARWRHWAKIAGLLVLLAVAATTATAAEPDIQRGHAIIAAECARCHAIELQGDSPLTAAPPFRDLHDRYPVEDLGEALAEGIVTGHADMPVFAFQPDEIDDIIAYLKTLEQ